MDPIGGKIRRLLRTAGPLALVAALTLAAAAPAQAKTVVRGKVKGGKGYTLIALARNGSAVTKKLGSNGSFKLRLKSRAGRGATLHLVRRNGSYFGPVVLRRKGRRAYLALSGRSVNLGSIPKKRGYARTRRATRKRAVNLKRSVRAGNKGKPVGAGKLGLVAKSKRKRATAHDAKQQASSDNDADSDGIPDQVDVDDDGDTVLDVSDPDSTETKGAAPVGTNIRVDLLQSLNVNAGGVTDAQIDQLVSDRLLLIFAGDNEASPKPTALNVNCFGLVYCKPGAGTAKVDLTSDLRGQPGAPTEGSKWTDYDPDGDGLPNVFRGQDGRFEMNVHPRVPTAQIAPGDSFEYVASTRSGPSTTVGALAPYFVTSPAITSYNSGGGAAAVSYPVTDGTPGTRDNPVRLASESLTLTFWRPQRPTVAGAESGDFIDMGGLKYGLEVQVEGGPMIIPTCESADYSGLSSTLQALPSDPGAQLVDTAADAAPNASNTLSFTIDVGTCLRRAGIALAGQTGSIELDARGARDGDLASQQLHVVMPG